MALGPAVQGRDVDMDRLRATPLNHVWVFGCFHDLFIHIFHLIWCFFVRAIKKSAREHCLQYRVWVSRPVLDGASFKPTPPPPSDGKRLFELAPFTSCP